MGTWVHGREEEKEKAQPVAFLGVGKLPTELLILTLSENIPEILFGRRSGYDAEVLHQIVQHIGRYERRQCGTEANVLDPEI